MRRSSRTTFGAVISKGADLVFCDKDEALAIFKTETVGDVCGALKQSTKTFAVNNGAQGGVLFDGQATVSVPSVPAGAVDTNGAGNMFAGICSDRVPRF